LDTFEELESRTGIQAADNTYTLQAKGGAGVEFGKDLGYELEWQTSNDITLKRLTSGDTLQCPAFVARQFPD
jgi:hypothetical protein